MFSNLFGDKKKKVKGEKSEIKFPRGAVKYKDYYFDSIRKSKKVDKKYDAVFLNSTTGKEKLVSFGSKKEKDYTQHNKAELKKFYEIKNKNKDYTDLMSSSSLNKYILWNKKTVDGGLRDYKRMLKEAK
jgi:hypothetical protein